MIQLRRIGLLPGVLMWALCASPADAQSLWTPNGVRVGGLPTAARPKVIADGAGGAVVAWKIWTTALEDDISGDRVLFDGSLDPRWPHEVFGGPPITREPNDQQLEWIVPDGAGGAYFLWRDWPSYRFFVHRVIDNGSVAPGWPAAGLYLGQAPQGGNSWLLADGAGGVYAFWHHARVVYAQRLTGNGVLAPGWPAGGLVVREADDAQDFLTRPLSGALDGAGGCYVIWRRITEELYFPEHYMQRLTGGGQVASGWPAEGRLILPSEGFGGLLGIGPDGEGGVYVAWAKIQTPSDPDADIWLKRVLGDGSIAPGWPLNGLVVAAYPGYQNVTRWTGMSADSLGGVLLAWEDSRTYPPRVFVQRLFPDGTRPPGWQEGGNPISDVDSYQGHPHVVPDGRGGAFVAFDDAFSTHGYVQHVTAAGALAAGWPSTGLRLVAPSVSAQAQYDLAIASDGEGGAIVAWEDTREYGGRGQIYAQRYTGDDITSAQTSLVRFEALPEQVTLLWARGTDAPNEVRIERQHDGEGWTVLANASFSGGGTLEYADRSVEPGARYGYRLGWSEPGGERRTEETHIEVPREIALALNGLRPNPAVAEVRVSFSLPGPGQTRVEVLDLAGRVVRSHDASGLGTGRHLVRMNGDERLHPGVYWVRLRHEGRTLTTKGMVLR